MAKAPDSFVRHIVEQLAPLGDISARAMFGGWCLFLDGDALALIDDGRLYLKVDDEVRRDFEAAGGEPFRYHHKGKGVDVEMRAYSTIPDEDLDDRPALLSWARRSAGAARRAGAQKRAKKATTTTTPRNGAKKPATKKTATTKKTAPKKTVTKKSATKKSATKRNATKRNAPKKSAPKKSATKRMARR